MIDPRNIRPAQPPALLRDSMETDRLGRFHDGGREAMIALPALTLANGQIEQAKQVLLSFARRISEEIAWSRLPDYKRKTTYRSADAPFWYFEAVRQFVKYTSDYAFVRHHLYYVLVNIVSWYVRGSHDGIKVDACGLITLSKPGISLTWMNAEVNGRAVTPRYGKPVEIQALWYNALCFLEELARRFGDDAAANRFSGRAAVAHWSFNRLFWNEKNQCLYDVVYAGVNDSTIRPNQVFAVSLQPTLLHGVRAHCVLRVVQRELLTPFGLRTLASADPQYWGQCEGNAWQRASAHHQGSVWPWLIGPFITAYIKLNQYSVSACEQASEWLNPLSKVLSERAGTQQLPEVFDGDSPHTPRGTRAHIWNDAEVRRAIAGALSREGEDNIEPKSSGYSGLMNIRANCYPGVGFSKPRLSNTQPAGRPTESSVALNPYALAAAASTMEAEL